MQTRRSGRSSKAPLVVSEAGWFGSDGCKQLSDAMQRVCDQAPEPEQGRQLATQFEAFVRQAEALQDLWKTQQQLLPHVPAQTHATPAKLEPEAPVTALGPPPRPAAKSLLVERIIPPASTLMGLPGEELVMSIFSLADSLTDEEARAMGIHAGLNVRRVQEHLTRLRSSVRGCLQRMQSRSSRETDTSGLKRNKKRSKAGEGVSVQSRQTGSALRPVKPDNSTRKIQTAQLHKLRAVLNDQGQIDPSAIGGAMSLAIMMKEAITFEVKEEQLSALAATPPHIMQSLITQQLLELFSAWLLDGEADKQTTFVRAVLRTSMQLPIPRALLVSSRLLVTVAGLVRSKNLRVVGMAQMALTQWQSQFDTLPAAVQRAMGAGSTGALSQLNPKPAGAPPAADNPGDVADKARALAVPLGRSGLATTAAEAGSGVSGAAGQRLTAEERGAAMAVPLGKQAGGKAAGTLPGRASSVGGALPTVINKITSADDIRKQRAKAAAKEAYAKSVATNARPPTPKVVSATGAGFQSLARKRSLPDGGATGPDAKKAASGFVVEEVAHEAQEGVEKVEQLAVGVSGSPWKGQSTADGRGSMGERKGGETETLMIDDLNAQEREALRQHTRAKQRRIEVTSAAVARTGDPALQREMINAVLQERDVMEARLTTARLAMEARLRSEDLTLALQAMRSKVPWSTPPCVICEDVWEPPAQGSPDFTEIYSRPSMRRTPSSHLIAKGPLPPDPMEPRPTSNLRTGASTRGPLQVPWMPLDKYEDAVQHIKMWEAGIRSPFLVWPPRNARAGTRPARLPSIATAVQQPLLPTPGTAPAATAPPPQSPPPEQQQPPLQQQQSAVTAMSSSSAARMVPPQSPPEVTAAQSQPAAAQGVEQRPSIAAPVQSDANAIAQQQKQKEAGRQWSAAQKAAQQEQDEAKRRADAEAAKQWEIYEQQTGVDAERKYKQHMEESQREQQRQHQQAAQVMAQLQAAQQQQQAEQASRHAQATQAQLRPLPIQIQAPPQQPPPQPLVQPHPVPAQYVQLYHVPQYQQQPPQPHQPPPHVYPMLASPAYQHPTPPPAQQQAPSWTAAQQPASYATPQVQHQSGHPVGQQSLMHVGGSTQQPSPHVQWHPAPTHPAPPPTAHSTWHQQPAIHHQQLSPMYLVQGQPQLQQAQATQQYQQQQLPAQPLPQGYMGPTHNLVASTHMALPPHTGPPPVFSPKSIPQQTLLHGSLPTMQPGTQYYQYP